MWGIVTKRTLWISLLIFSVGLLADPAFLTIEEDDVECEIGENLHFQAIYTDTAGVEHDTTASWSIAPDSLGTIGSTGTFHAAAPGECLITATLDTLSAWVTVVIEAEDIEDPEEEANQNLVILPTDTSIVLGETIQYQVFYPDSSGLGTPVDTTIIWSIDGMPIGNIDENGLFTSISNGFGLVSAQVGDYNGTAFVIVENTQEDSVDINSIMITRDSPNPSGYSVMRNLEEGEVWTLSGLPHPMNILNGSSVYFPQGSLHEDIRLHISLPGFFNVSDDSIGHGSDHVLGGIDFQVIVEDSVYESYTFDEALIVGVIYKKGLIEHMGLQPEWLSLYYAETYADTLAFDSLGLAYTTLDLYQNRIFSAVPHFTTLVIAGFAPALNLEPGAYELPVDFQLHQNYPNPFNPITSIRYSLSQNTNIKLRIFDISGREVRSLASGDQVAGDYTMNWDGLDAQGLQMSTGVYFARLDAGHDAKIVKMLLLK